MCPRVGHSRAVLFYFADRFFALRAKNGSLKDLDLRCWRTEPSAARYFIFQVCAVFPRVARKNRTQEDRRAPSCTMCITKRNIK